ncbi:hypothetical protein CRG98_006722 [Punica granatum]|uniref:Uncharacterized protein n=1 Tax=Punica granatum TaxID=22663 RepID=A0A2I0KWK8_PUNGR|nr:hypothetical protein CRG98_006722 [Punica granatum]
MARRPTLCKLEFRLIRARMHATHRTAWDYPPSLGTRDEHGREGVATYCLRPEGRWPLSCLGLGVHGTRRTSRTSWIVAGTNCLRPPQQVTDPNAALGLQMGVEGRQRHATRTRRALNGHEKLRETGVATVGCANLQGERGENNHDRVHAGSKPVKAVNARPKPAKAVNVRPKPVNAVNVRSKPVKVVNAGPRPGKAVNAGPRPAKAVHVMLRPAKAYKCGAEACESSKCEADAREARKAVNVNVKSEKQ